MTGKKLHLKDIVAQALEDVGHKIDDLYSSFDLDPSQAIAVNTLKVYSDADAVYAKSYEIKIDNNKQTVQIQIGRFPEFDFHDPGSITLFKAAVLQVRTLMALKAIRDELDDLL